jgi:SAM-dependent methyltransferase
VQRALGAENVRRAFAGEYLRAVPGERLLDLGCGPGDVLAHLPSLDYLGVDVSAAYIAAARERYGTRATFRRRDLRDLDGRELGDERFDAVISIGVLHHLDDDEASGMLRLAGRALASPGRLVTLDPAIDAGQPRLARWLIGRDRGRSVRSASAYAALAGPYFGSVRTTVRHDLARVPYTHVIMECRRPLEHAPVDAGSSSGWRRLS